MDGKPEVSVVVPSFDRRASLLRLLESLERQTFPRERFEVLVVDNGSADGTPEAVGERAARNPMALRCVVERTPGAAHARNRGVTETVAPLVAFTDDDVEVEPGWLAEIVAGFSGGAAAVGGRTIAVWGAPLPDWWLPEYEKPFARNWGDESCEVTSFPFFYSLNLAIRRDALDAVGLFDTRLGPKRHRHVVGEDADLCRRIHESGRRLWYAPRAVVRHHVEPERLTRRFFRRRFYYAGMTHVSERAIEGRDLALGYQAKAIAAALSRWIAAGSAAERFRHELQLWYRAGNLVRGLALKADAP